MRNVSVIDSWQHSTLGRLYLTVNARCRRLNVRCYQDGLLVTVPPGLSRSVIQDALLRMEPQLLQMLKRQAAKAPVRQIDWNFQLHTDSFNLLIKPSKDHRFYIHHEGVHEAWLLCPTDTDFTAQQSFLIKTIEECLRKHAQQYFPGQLRQLVHQHQFKVSGLKIRNMNSRWGSCSSHQEIHISSYVMLLPLHLQQLILLHELCHTVHMNHGPQFHALLNQVTGGNEDRWNKELKSFKTDILSF